MRIISFKPSISRYFGSHDAAVVLLEDNEISSILEEERFSRVKHAFNQFPINAINKTLEMFNLSMYDIDYITIPFIPSDWFFAENLNHDKVIEEAHYIISNELKQKYSASEIPPIYYYNHHLSHAASAYYLSGFEDSLIITVDGTGEKEASVIWKAEGGKIEIIKQFNWPNSLGVLFADFTGFFGFKPLDGEGKLMGLSAYGNYNEKFNKLFNDKIMHINEDGYQISSDYLAISKRHERYGYIEKVFYLRRLEEKKREIFNKDYQDLAYVLHTSMEQALLSLIKIGQKIFHSKNLCLAGGIAMNCGINGKLLDAGLIKDIFIQPLAGDNGCMIGSAILKFISETGRSDFKRLTHLYYGTRYDNIYIEKMLKQKGMTYRYMEEPWKYAAKLLSDDKIVGWFQGKMEVGARALGNRSILSNPAQKRNKDRVNELKNREKWRPLAMSIIDKRKHEYLSGIVPHCADFMIIARKIKDDVRGKIPAALHFDNTTRPQVINKDVNEPYYNLVEEFYRLTGIPLVINTSMNARGEPIVECPEQALDFFCTTELDGLFLENYFIGRDYDKKTYMLL